MKGAHTTGLYFGSFNPVHIGHMAIANYMVEHSGIKEIWFVVSPQNPFKKQATLLDNYQRLDLVHKAINSDIRFTASNIEFNLPKPSYTIDTLTYLKEKHPGKTFSLVMGADNLFHFHKWKNFEIIRDNYPVFVYPRPGVPREGCPTFPGLNWVDAPIIEISASFIRNAIKQGKDVRHFMPFQVWQYIDEMGFYR